MPQDIGHRRPAALAGTVDAAPKQDHASTPATDRPARGQDECTLKVLIDARFAAVDPPTLAGSHHATLAAVAARADRPLLSAEKVLTFEQTWLN